MTSRGGVTQEGCAILVNEEAERVVYKNNYAFHAVLFNIYMVCPLVCSTYCGKYMLIGTDVRRY